MNPEELAPIRKQLRDLDFNLTRAFQMDYTPYGLTMLQGRLLTTVECENGLAIGELADLLNMTPGNVSTLCKRLEKQGYLKRTRTEQDARVVFVTITQEGKETLKNINRALKKRFEAATLCGHEDLKIITEGLERSNQLLATVARQSGTIK